MYFHVGICMIPRFVVYSDPCLYFYA